MQCLSNVSQWEIQHADVQVSLAGQHIRHEYDEHLLSDII